VQLHAVGATMTFGNVESCVMAATGGGKGISFDPTLLVAAQVRGLLWRAAGYSPTRSSTISVMETSPLVSVAKSGIRAMGTPFASHWPTAETVTPKKSATTLWRPGAAPSHSEKVMGHHKYLLENNQAHTCQSFAKVTLMEMQDRRRERLRAWVEGQGGQAAVISRRHLTKSHASYLSQILGGYRLGERAAREWERRLGLAQGWLDDHTLEELPRPIRGATVTLESTTIVPLLRWEELMTEGHEIFRCKMPDGALLATPPGTVLLCSKSEPPQFGKGVIVADAAGEMHIRRYKQGVDGHWLAEADAPGFATFRSEDGATIVAAVVAKYDGAV
jgi:hypothetical protein